MASYMRKCISLGAEGIKVPGSNQDIRFADNGPMFIDTRTNWVRFVVDLSVFVTNGFQDAQGKWWLSWNQMMLNALDAQIEAAKHTPVGAASGMSVIVSFTKFPRWMNGTVGLLESDTETQKFDRYAGPGSSEKKSWEYRFPDDVSATSAWAAVVRTICQRYHPLNEARPSPNCWIDAIAPLNEPNKAYFPQTGVSPDQGDPWKPGTLSLGCKVAQMIASAAAVISGFGGRPLLVVPGLIDTDHNSSRFQTNVYQATEAIVSGLQSASMPINKSVVWGHNMYGDVTDQSKIRKVGIRYKLKGRWPGWPFGDANSPNIWGLEGGVPLHWGFTESQQQTLLRSWWNLMNNDNDAQGAGVALFTQYLFHTDTATGFDSGLRSPETGPGARLAYYDPWRIIRQDP